MDILRHFGVTRLCCWCRCVVAVAVWAPIQNPHAGSGARQVKWLLFDLQLPSRKKSRGLWDSPSVEFLHPFFLEPSLAFSFDSPCHTVVHHASPKQEVCTTHRTDSSLISGHKPVRSGQQWLVCRPVASVRLGAAPFLQKTELGTSWNPFAWMNLEHFDHFV